LPFVAAAACTSARSVRSRRDVALLMQPEVGEAFESGGGSSTMPHKRNPSGCAVVRAADPDARDRVATMLAAMVQEHERGVGGWQVEAPTLVDAVQTSAAAVAAMADVCESSHGRRGEDAAEPRRDARRGLRRAR
jgi:3-carboxy-cis,cis-muconate cycloisomerase